MKITAPDLYSPSLVTYDSCDKIRRVLLFCCLRQKLFTRFNPRRVSPIQAQLHHQFFLEEGTHIDAIAHNVRLRR